MQVPVHPRQAGNRDAPGLAVEQNVVGFRLRPQQPAELYDALITLFSEETLRASLGQAGRQKVINEYSLDVTAERLVALYQELVSISAFQPLAAGR